MNANLRWPFGKALNLGNNPIAYASTININLLNSNVVDGVQSMANSLTFAKIAQLTGNTTLTVSIDPETQDGDALHLTVSADSSNRTITFSTGFTAVNLTVTASQTVRCVFVYDSVSGTFVNTVNTRIA